MISCPCSAISASLPASSGLPVTDHHDHDIPRVIKASQHAKVLFSRDPGLAAIRCWQPGTEEVVMASKRDDEMSF
jgi:hypothetical protein